MTCLVLAIVALVNRIWTPGDWHTNHNNLDNCDDATQRVRQSSLFSRNPVVIIHPLSPSPCAPCPSRLSSVAPRSLPREVILRTPTVVKPSSGDSRRHTDIVVTGAGACFGRRVPSPVYGPVIITACRSVCIAAMYRPACDMWRRRNSSMT